MDFALLRSTLAIDSGTLTLSRDSLGAGLTGLWDTCFPGQSLVISDAAPGPGDGTNGAVVITGRSTFLQAHDVPTTARFSLEAGGAVRVLIRYQLRDGAPPPGAWKPSRSFPTLPTVFDYSTPLAAEVSAQQLLARQLPLVDSLNLFDTGYVVSSHAGEDPVLGAPLEPGINLVSRLRPAGQLGILQAVAGATEPLILHGPVRIPRPTDQTLALVPRQRPWERRDAPGLHLEAPLAIDFTLGKLAFKQGTFRIYTPLASEWLEQNPTFEPRHAYTGQLSVPSAGLSLDVGVDLEWGSLDALLVAKCQGVALGKLSQLADLVGGASLAALLPQELQSAIDTLGRLELTELRGGLSAVNGTPGLQQLSMTVGLPGLVWKVWDDHFQIRDLACRFDISSPLSSPSITVTLMGTLDLEGVKLQVIADNSDGFTLYARLTSEETLPLAALLAKHAPGVPAPSDLTVNRLSVTVAPGRSYQMSMLLADKPKPWTLPVGKLDLKLENLLFDFTYPKGGPVTGAFSGTAALGDDFLLSMACTIPGSVVLRGTARNLQLRKLVAQLCDQPGTLPPDFDLTFDSLSVLVSKKNSDYAFQAACEIAGFGTFAFEARRFATGKSGFAAGLSLSASTLSRVQGLGGLAPLEKFVKLQKLLVVPSSFDDAQFTLPDMSRFNQPALATKNVTLPGTGGVKAGLNVFAEWTLDTGDKQQNLLKTLLGLDGPQQVTLQVGQNPAQNSRLMVSRSAKLQGRPFNCAFGVQLTNGSPSFFLTGSLTVDIQKQPQTFDLTTVFVSGGAFMAATMKGATAVDCGPFKLSNLALQIGVNWGGIPSLGVAATLDVKKFQSSVAVFFDSTNPAKSLVAGSISSLTVKDVMDTLVGGNLNTPMDDLLKGMAVKGTHQFTLAGDVSDALDNLDYEKVSSAFNAAKVPIPSSSQQLTLVTNKKGASWHLTDLSRMRHYELEKKGNTVQVQVAPQFYFAPQATSIGSIAFPQAYYLNAALSFAGFDISATIDIAQNKGLSVEAQMDRIVLVDEKLFSLTASTGGGGPKVSISTFSQPADPVPEFRPPHFYVNGALTMFGLKRALFASVTVNGVEFELKGALMPGVVFDVDVRFGKSGLDAGGTVRVGITTIDLGALGKAKLNTDVEAALDIDIDGNTLSMTLDSGFQFAGQNFDIAKFKVDAKPDTFTKLADILGNKIKDVLTDAFKDMNQWANAVGKGAMDGVNDVEKVYRDVYKKSEKDAKALAKTVSGGVNQGVKAVENVGKDLGKGTKKAGKSLKKAFRL